MKITEPSKTSPFHFFPWDSPLHGPSIHPNHIHFSLWAPLQKNVFLILGTDSPLEMNRQKDGWFFIDLPRRQLNLETTYGFQLDDGLIIPDPASRFQPGNVHQPSQLMDLNDLQFCHDDFPGISPEQMILNEIHVGTFTPEGTLDAAIQRLPLLAELGVNAVELMPIGAFDGETGWGYDGVLPFAVHRTYGGPHSLARFVDAAHGLGISVFLDVVYNHFGPSGCYLAKLAPWFNDKEKTPWGPSINFSQSAVRTFVLQNAIFWLSTFHLDGLRLDAIHAIRDEFSPQHILAELSNAVAAMPSTRPGARRPILIGESHLNDVAFIRPVHSTHFPRIPQNEETLLNGSHSAFSQTPPFPKNAQTNFKSQHRVNEQHLQANSSFQNVQPTQPDRGRLLIELSDTSIEKPLRKMNRGMGLHCQWSDDLHHALHALLTGERIGYYADFGDLHHLAAAFENGQTYIGQYSKVWKGPHGTPTAGLPGSAFLVFDQNHDQIGNRPWGDRLATQLDLPKLKLAAAATLLSPFVPMLFMGESWGETAPFPFFTDFPDKEGLGRAVTKGRMAEFKKYGWQQLLPKGWESKVPPPQSKDTFLKGKIHPERRLTGQGRELWDWFSSLIATRKSFRKFTARCVGAPPTGEILVKTEGHTLTVQRPIDGDDTLLAMNFSDIEGMFFLPPGKWKVLADSQAPTVRKNRNGRTRPVATIDVAIPGANAELRPWQVIFARCVDV